MCCVCVFVCVCVNSVSQQAPFDKFAFYDRSRGHASKFRVLVESLLVARARFSLAQVANGLHDPFGMTSVQIVAQLGRVGLIAEALQAFGPPIMYLRKKGLI